MALFRTLEVLLKGSVKTATFIIRALALTSARTY